MRGHEIPARFKPCLSHPSLKRLCLARLNFIEIAWIKNPRAGEKNGRAERSVGNFSAMVAVKEGVRGGSFKPQFPIIGGY